MISIQQFICNPFSENSFVLYDNSRECIFIDPGFQTDQERNLVAKFVSNHKLKPTKIIITHGHLDHVMGAAWLANKYKIELFGHADEAIVLHYVPEFANRYGIQMDKPPKLAHTLHEGQKLNFGESALDIIHVPGHSPGSLIFYSPEQNFCLAGDVLFNGGIGRSDLPGGNHQQLIDGIKTKLLILPDNTIVHAGHGENTTIGIERTTNSFLN